MFPDGMENFTLGPVGFGGSGGIDVLTGEPVEGGVVSTGATG
jgi:hypothetical protein